MAKNFLTDSGIPIDPVYTPEHLEKISFDYDKDLGLPGNWPYTRGIDPEMYRAGQWIESVYMGFGSPEDCNKKLLNLLKEGKEIGLHVAMDLPTQLGLDSDNPLASAEVGRVGVAIDSLRDMEILFDNVDIRTVKIRRHTCLCYWTDHACNVHSPWRKEGYFSKRLCGKYHK